MNSILLFLVTTKPSDFLKQVVGKRVVVKLNSGVEYHGKKNTNKTKTSNI